MMFNFVVRILLTVSTVFILVLAKNTLTQKLMSEEEKEESGIHGKVSDASRVRRSYYGHCFSTDTWFTSDGNGRTIYLDQQSPNCGLFAMRSFHLVRNNGGDKVRYDLSCCHLPKNYKCQTSTMHTKFDMDGADNVIYLDRQHVSCPHDGFLKHFQLNRNTKGDLYRYTYSCCSPRSHRSEMVCYNSQTPANTDGKGDMVNLDKHRPSCHFGYFLNGFHLVRPTLTTIQYKYRCCAFYQ